MGSEELTRVKVYYDGLCQVCSREMDHYKTQAGAENIEFVDICAPGFDPALERLDPVRVHKEMHARRRDGSLATGVEAFVVIWQTLPKFNFLAHLAKQKQIRAGLNIGYAAFAKIRPWLPRKAAPADCESSPYCETKNAKPT